MKNESLYRIRRIICFFKLWGTRNYYQGLDKPTIWQWLYKWRLSANTSWKVSGIIWATVGYKFSTSSFMVLRGKEHGNIFWTSGGKYREDWYELLFESDNEEEVRNYWHEKLFGKNGRYSYCENLAKQKIFQKNQ